MTSVEEFCRALARLHETPYDCPRVRMERRVCGFCERETDHEVGEWPEHPFERGMLFARERRIAKCLHCGKSHVRRTWFNEPIRLPRIGEVYPPPYLVRSA